MSSRTKREKAAEVREKLQDGAGEIAVRYDDEYGHQYWVWDGEIRRITHLRSDSDGTYNGPYGTSSDLLKRMVSYGNLEFVDREDTPFGGDSSE
ncbi:hypothetical protein [Natrinema pallidum]|uniref:Uncharacterized protein n=1 Tax=Natrinema pallidum TaxID=69527 RepID=A0A4P9TM32_9EURY|nr:hypothetical protein [Natrinema pallidum]QCW05285.1 hypothetical protein FGF80_18765 [Natrinema pallidum]